VAVPSIELWNTFSCPSWRLASATIRASISSGAVESQPIIAIMTGVVLVGASTSSISSRPGMILSGSNFGWKSSR